VLKVRFFAGVASLVAIAALSACSPPTAPTLSATPTPSASASEGTVAQSFGPKPPLVVGGTAIDNKPLFEWALKRASQSLAADPGRSLVDTLVAVGFDKGAIQVTPSISGTGQPADQIVISLQIGTSCLIGQRMLDKAFHSTVEASLGSGGCLIGETRKIDW
jgi:hypothetical protein